MTLSLGSINLQELGEREGKRRGEKRRKEKREKRRELGPEIWR